jgi:4-amino-4-deoxy-L-arabinose transferase-like glycosyltransferase
MIRSKPLWNYAGFSGLALTGLYMAWISWRKWPEPFIDYGRQVYVPWRISEGAVLYRDLHYLYGPFSQYCNALLFKLFGPHLLTLALFNHLIVAAVAWLLFTLVREAADNLSAFAATGFFLAVFAFSQYSAIANFNYICPYVHEITHAFLFALGAILAFLRYLKFRRERMLWLSGFLAGLVFMTKIEILAALAAALALGMGALTILERRPAGAWGKAAAAFAAGFWLAPALFFLYFSMKMPIAEAWDLFWLPLTILIRTPLVTHPLYQWYRGTLDTAGSLSDGFAALRWHAVLLAGLVGSCRLINNIKTESGRLWAVRVFWAGSAAALVYLYGRIYWFNFFRPLPLYMLGFSVFAAARILKSRGLPEEAARWTPRLMLAVFAFVLLWKVLLRTLVLYYGFVLAVPATLAMIAVLLHFLPKILERRVGPSGYVKPVLAGFIFICALWHVNQCRDIYRQKTFPLGKGADQIFEVTPRKDRMEQLADRMLEKIQEQVPSEKTLAVFPMGQILNFWAKRASSLPYDNFTPLAFVTAGGEERIIKDLDASPPDFAVLIDMDASTE